MLKEFTGYIEDNKLVNKNDRVLLAVSGGIDSMVMAHLFIRAGIKTGIAHCNFCLRGEDSEKDEELVRQFAARNKKDFFNVRFDTEAYAKEKGISIQMAARDLRYTWFEKIRKMYEFDSVAIAHNLNDNIETILINLTRGTGIAGLSGIRKTRERVIRPLLFATRKSIENYCKENHIDYREDKSNTETKYIRNKIRHLVLPLLSEINPSIESTLKETSDRLNDINAIFTAYTIQLRKKVIKKKSMTSEINIEKLNPYLNNNTLLFELFRPFGLRPHSLNDLRNIIAGQSGSEIITPTHRIIKNRQELIISEITITDDSCLHYKDLNEFRECPLFKSVRLINITARFRLPASRNTACLDLEQITFPVTVRNWQHGDYFYPLGMKHRKKLSDYFIDNKIPVLTKGQIKILISGNKTVWIIGERIDDRFKITDSTRKVLIIKAKC